MYRKSDSDYLSQERYYFYQTAQRDQIAACSAVGFSESDEMKFKKVEPGTVQCTTSVIRPFGCMELWAGNERAHRSLELAGLEADVIAVPSGADSGGDLSAIFSCSDNVARVVLADCVGHGYVASSVARHIHKLLHKFQDTRDTAGLLASLNNEFTLDAADDDGSLRLTTVVTGTFDATTGEFNFAYAAHPRMLLWRASDEKFHPIGDGMENFPLGFITGEEYTEQSVKLDPGDMILAFSDGATEVESPAGIQLSPSGFLDFAHSTLSKLPTPQKLPDFSKSLLTGIHEYRGSDQLEDDITLLTLRRTPQP
jgi:serine phosphatase RsbU (regulator of sigma subunit)